MVNGAPCQLSRQLGSGQWIAPLVWHGLLNTILCTVLNVFTMYFCCLLTSFCLLTSLSILLTSFITSLSFVDLHSLYNEFIFCLLTSLFTWLHFLFVYFYLVEVFPRFGSPDETGAYVIFSWSVHDSQDGCQWNTSYFSLLVLRVTTRGRDDLPLGNKGCS